jgi:hypothetical protein
VLDLLPHSGPLHFNLLDKEADRRTKDLCIREEVQGSFSLCSTIQNFPQTECYPFAPPPSIPHHSSTSIGRDGAKKEKKETKELERNNRVHLGGQIFVLT